MSYTIGLIGCLSFCGAGLVVSDKSSRLSDIGFGMVLGALLCLCGVLVITSLGVQVP